MNKELQFNDLSQPQVGGSRHPGHILGAGGQGAGLLHVQEVSGVHNVLSLLLSKY